jgi:hypothetical protein
MLPLLFVLLAVSATVRADDVLELTVSEGKLICKWNPDFRDPIRIPVSDRLPCRMFSYFIWYFFDQ